MVDVVGNTHPLTAVAVGAVYAAGNVSSNIEYDITVYVALFVHVYLIDNGTSVVVRTVPSFLTNLM